MKILLDGRSITSKTSGISRYTYELIKGYVVHYGYDSVRVILNAEIEDFPWQYIIVPYNRHSYIDTCKFSHWLSLLEYDVYHAGDCIGPFWHDKKKHRHIVTVHDLMFWNVREFHRKHNLKTLLHRYKTKWFFGALLRDADEIISISQTTKKDVMDIYKRNSIVVREGVNRLAPMDSKLKDFMGLKPDSFFFYVGLGAPHKNIDFLVNTFLETETDKKLVLCGRGHKVVEDERIVYPGFVSDEELDFLYKNCAAFIFPSLYEGFGLPILEALSYHCKVFSSNAGSLGEFSDEVLWFFDPHNNDQLKALMQKVDDLKIKEKQIDDYLSMFNWDLIWKEYHDGK